LAGTRKKILSAAPTQENNPITITILTYRVQILANDMHYAEFQQAKKTHNAIKNIDKGLFQAFCKIVP
jgi:hypothetical protein